MHPINQKSRHAESGNVGIWVRVSCNNVLRVWKDAASRTVRNVSRRAQHCGSSDGCSTKPKWTLGLHRAPSAAKPCITFVLSVENVVFETLEAATPWRPRVQAACLAARTLTQYGLCEERSLGHKGSKSRNLDAITSVECLRVNCNWAPITTCLPFHSKASARQSYSKRESFVRPPWGPPF